MLVMPYVSYAMCTRGLPDVYTLSPRASGVYIRQTTRAHGITITYALISVRISIRQTTRAHGITISYIRTDISAYIL